MLIRVNVMHYNAFVPVCLSAVKRNKNDFAEKQTVPKLS